jgi:hypothetical protein
VANGSTELIQYLDEQFRGVNKRLEELTEHFSSLQSSVDGYAKRADAYFQEMTVLSTKVERHERWLHQVADKLGLKFEHD